MAALIITISFACCNYGRPEWCVLIFAFVFTFWTDQWDCTRLK